MSEEQVTQTETTEVVAEPTLDDVYASVKFEEPVQQQQPVQQQPVQSVTQPAPLSVPDPYDTEAFKAYMAQQAAGTTELQKAVQSTVNFLSDQQRQVLARKTSADIEAAVKAADEIVGLGKPKVIEAWLDGKAREDTKFKQLWDNREKHPTAWQNALKAVAREMANDFSVKVDPKLAAAQQARRLSQSQMATTQREENDGDPDWGAKNGADFDRGWESMVGRGN